MNSIERTPPQMATPEVPDRRLFIVCAMVVVGLLQLELAFAKSINWDEFFHFSDIHRHLQGLPASWLQVPFVWLYFWVPQLPGEVVFHIQITRLLTLFFEGIAVWAIVLSARTLTDRESALLAGLTYMTGGYVFLHAFSLRADVIAASLLSVALYIAITNPLRVRAFLLIAFLFTLAFLSTIKSVLYIPALLGILLCRAKARTQYVGFVFALTITICGGLLVAFSSHLPVSGPLHLLKQIADLGHESLLRMFSAGFLPQSRWLAGQILAAPVLTLALLLGACSWAIGKWTPSSRATGLLLLLPLCTILFYRNAYPYYYAFILPPAIIAATPGLRMLRERYGAAVVAMFLVGNAAILSLWQDREVLPRQKAIIAGIHQIFPEPVMYFDDCAIASNFPRAVNRYMSGWGLEKYRRAGAPIYLRAAQADVVPLVLADGDAAGTTCFDFMHRGAILPEDAQFFRENYVQHWGNVFVAGKRLQVDLVASTFEIIVPGSYTVEGGAITLDDIEYSDGSVINLSRGTHRMSTLKPGRRTLRWGDNLARPEFHWPQGALFTEF